MNRIIDLGKVDYWGIGRKTCPVDVEIELRTSDKGKELAICGTIWNPRKTDCYSAGQNLDTIAELIHTDEFNEIYRFWKLYHLNGMHAGTEKQEEALKNCPSKDYAEQCEYLESIDLLIDNGYRYGTSWLFREIPADDLKRIEEIING